MRLSLARLCVGIPKIHPRRPDFRRHLSTPTSPGAADPSLHGDAHASASSLGDVVRSHGNAAFAAGKYRDAVSYYSAAIKVEPLDSRAWCERALVYIKMSNPLLALGDTTVVLEREPGNTLARQRMAWAYHDAGILEPALHHYVRSNSPAVTAFLFTEAGAAVIKALAAGLPLPSSPVLDEAATYHLLRMRKCLQAFATFNDDLKAALENPACRTAFSPGMSPAVVRVVAGRAAAPTLCRRRCTCSFVLQIRQLHENSLRGGLTGRWFDVREARQASQVPARPRGVLLLLLLLCCCKERTWSHL